MTTPNHSPAVEQTAPTPNAATADQTPFTVTHKWPWRAGEFGTMSFFAALCFGIGYIADDRWGTLIGAVAAVASVGVLYRTKTRRVNESAATATLTGTRLAVTSDGALGRSAVDLAKVTDIGYRRFASDECFMLFDGTQGVRLPIRLLDTPTLSEQFEIVWTSGAETSIAAENLYDRVHSSAQ